MKTAELTGLLLDWAVAQCEGGTDFRSDGITWGFNLHGKQKVLSKGWAESMSYHPSTNWTQGGQIIDLHISRVEDFGDYWEAESCGFSATGESALVAAMRAYVIAKLGFEVSVPEALK